MNLTIPPPAPPGDVDDGISRRMLERAAALFQQYGFRRVTMDDIARELGISKKTLYQHVRSKDELVERTVEMLMGDGFVQARAMFVGSHDVIELTTQLIPFLRARMAHVSPAMMGEMQRYYPHLWASIDARRTEVLGHWARLIEQGQRDGLIRAEIDPQVTVKVIQTVVQEVANPTTILDLQVGLPDVMETILTLLMRGALTDEARAEYEEETR